MRRSYTDLIYKMKLNPAASREALQRVQNHFGFNFPKDYANFLLEANGAEGVVGITYLVLWSTYELEALNTAYAVNKFAPGLVLIGSNGGDTGYGIDSRSSDMAFIEVPFIGLGLEEIKVRAKNFVDFLESLSTENYAE